MNDIWLDLKLKSYKPKLFKSTEWGKLWQLGPVLMQQTITPSKFATFLLCYYYDWNTYYLWQKYCHWKRKRRVWIKEQQTLIGLTQSDQPDPLSPQEEEKEESWDERHVNQAWTCWLMSYLDEMGLMCECGLVSMSKTLVIWTIVNMKIWIKTAL